MIIQKGRKCINRPDQDSNPGPLSLQSGALPTDLSHHQTWTPSRPLYQHWTPSRPLYRLIYHATSAGPPADVSPHVPFTVLSTVVTLPVSMATSSMTAPSVSVVSTLEMWLHSLSTYGMELLTYVVNVADTFCSMAGFWGNSMKCLIHNSSSFICPSNNPVPCNS
jgi:hypothetical protein